MALSWLRRATRAFMSGQVYPRRWRRLGLALLVAGAPACNAFTLDDDRQLGEEAYNQIIEGQTLVRTGSAHEMVNRLKDRLVAAARVDHQEIVDHFEWQVELIEEDGTVNAFALPGGKMAVYTGILPVAQTEAGLAVVMGHEIAHVIERHGTEAMTRQYGAEVLIQIVFEGSAAELAALAGNLASLKFGRGAELEADRMGLTFMARAGYDPRVAVTFWTRMAELSGGAPPEWLSTHPSNEHRIQQIEDLLPGVIPIYEANKAQTP